MGKSDQEIRIRGPNSRKTSGDLFEAAIDRETRKALNRWKKICGDTRCGALMFSSSQPGVPFTNRNWLERNLQPVAMDLGIPVPVTFQVLRRSFATHNQKQLKDVQAHLGHERTSTTADLYVVEIPAEVRKTQQRFAQEIDRLAKKKEAAKRPLSVVEFAQISRPGKKLDAAGRAF
jgi:integrase